MRPARRGGTGQASTYGSGCRSRATPCHPSGRSRCRRTGSDRCRRRSPPEPRPRRSVLDVDVDAPVEVRGGVPLADLGLLVELAQVRPLQAVVPGEDRVGVVLDGMLDFVADRCWRPPGSLRDRPSRRDPATFRCRCACRLAADGRWARRRWSCVRLRGRGSGSGSGRVGVGYEWMDQRWSNMAGSNGVRNVRAESCRRGRRDRDGARKYEITSRATMSISALPSARGRNRSTNGTR